jgi:hypothetical protein
VAGERITRRAPAIRCARLRLVRRAHARRVSWAGRRDLLRITAPTTASR